jgi:uncharacterized protein
MIVIDTSVVLAFMDAADASHEIARDWMDHQDQELLTTPLVVAELDHLTLKYGGTPAAHALREDLDDGAPHSMSQPSRQARHAL